MLNLLHCKEESGGTFLHTQGKYNNQNPSKEMLKLLFDRLDSNIVKDLLFIKDNAGNTFLYRLNHYHGVELFYEFMPLLLEKIGHESTVLFAQTCADNVVVVV